MKIKVSVSMGLVGCRRDEVLEIDDDELDGLSERKRNEVLDDYCNQWMANEVDWGWEELP